MSSKDSDGLVGTSQTSYRLFVWVKYLVYVLLSFNIYLFLQEELSALEHTFVDGFELSQIIQVFSATIDTAAWVLLLLLFELETSVLDDDKIRGSVKWSLHGLRLVCYAAVFYAFTGYYAELVALYQVTSLAAFDACASLEQGLDGFAVEPGAVDGCDEYRPTSCGSQPTLDAAGAPCLRLAIENNFRS